MSKGHLSPKINALKTALQDRNPFYSGRCTVPDYQRLLYYTHDDVHRRIDVTKAGVDELEALYRACKPAEFGRNGENVLDESYRKAGKLDLTAFSTLLDPRSLGIHDQVSKALLVQSQAGMEAELYKLNVYGEGDFFKPHKDTPRGRGMFGSLVVILPTAHEGGQFVLRQGGKEWTLDFADKFEAGTEPSVCFVAFYSDIDHEVLPVTSGYRVTLTFNLYYVSSHFSDASILTPFHLKLKQALADLVNDKSVLPNGGYLGFGLVHEYVHTGQNLVEPLYVQLKGSDGALADVCEELKLDYTLRLLYREIADPRINLITTQALDVEGAEMTIEESSASDYLRQAVSGLDIHTVEGVTFVGGLYPFDTQLWNEEEDYYGYGAWLKALYRTPITEVFEITRMKSSVNVKSMFLVYGNESEVEHFYGTACMLVKVDPAASRKAIEL